MSSQSESLLEVFHFPLHLPPTDPVQPTLDQTELLQDELPTTISPRKEIAIAHTSLLPPHLGRVSLHPHWTGQMVNVSPLPERVAAVVLAVVGLPHPIQQSSQVPLRFAVRPQGALGLPGRSIVGDEGEIRMGAGGVGSHIVLADLESLSSL